MNNTVLVACETLKKELEASIEETEVDYEIIWVESGLHNTPEFLKSRLQEELDKLDNENNNVERVLLAFGFCGNSVLGLKSRNFELILPGVEDCITLLLGSDDKRKEVSDSGGTYFLTRGWLDNEKNIWYEYSQTVEKYGEEKADRIYEMMLKNYSRLGIVDTGIDDIEDFSKTTKQIAKALKLEHFILPGTLEYFKKLLTGPYDSDFVVLEPNSEIKFQDILQ
ncbi:DUF1638 domain-containing protein [Natranaerofaba carboxydovora]|uniref:DUF1638 domain-containing protein n=1 Tax=Natranaerofaba carboxydovora TaxID=2742683 RepID=UPI001F144859|nr:DUF1638 domain-containing protein [Natranaerofaba carboxydovora]UMZ74341.1 hypothetical protein ACONDI_01929 [Natranaerofaba carboxydovora]